MTIRERLQNIGQALTGNTPKIEVPTKEKDFLGGQISVDYGLTTQTKVSDKLLNANTGWVYKNNDVIAKEVGTIEFELFNVKVVAKEVVFEPITTHPLLDALDKFNEFTTASDGFYLTSSHKTLTGDAFWYVLGKGINIQGLYLLQPDKVTIKLGDPNYGQAIIDKYEFMDSVNGKNVSLDYETDEIIHFKNPNPNNPYRGKSKVVAAAEAIDTDNYALEAVSGLFKRGLITNNVFSTDGHLTVDQLSQLEAQLRAGHAGAQNSYKTLVLSGGMKPESIQMTNREAEFIELQKWLRDKIMSVFGNTPSSIGIVEDVNRANAESGILHWKRTTVKAEMKAITDTIQEFLVPRFGDNLLLAFKDPVPEDRETKLAEVKVLRETNTISPNEAREIMGYDPSTDEDADKLRVTVPPSVANVDLNKFMRKSGLAKQLESNTKVREAARVIATKLVKSKKKKTEPIEVQEHETFTNEQVWNFHNKQIRIVEALEDAFENKVKQFIDHLVDKALNEIPNEVSAMKNKALIDEDEELVRAGINFKPILTEVALLSGQSALSLIGDDKPYISQDIHKTIERNVKLFATSMIETDRDKMIDIIAQGIANGDSIPTIRGSITDTFDEYSKTQANRIARTEVIRASNQGTLDAWDKSDVVVAKQWLTAEDDRVDPECDALNGEIMEMGGIYEKNDYMNVKSPPLHPNCRCTLLPVLDNQKSFDAKRYTQIRAIKKDIALLEEKAEKADKRTKEYKLTIEEKDKYIKELEEYLDV